MNREYTLKQICKMISSGDIPKVVYDKYLSKTPVGFMNYKELCNFFEIGDSNINFDAFELAFCKGKLRKWVLEKLIIDTLYKTTDELAIYIKVNDINCFGKPDDETDKELIYKYGYQFQVPKTEIDLIVNKKDGKLKLKRVGLGWGYENVEKVIYKDITKQMKLKNLYFQTNFNNEKYLIK